jgi:hypothetical protein
LRGKNVRSSGLIGVLFQKRRKKIYENSTRHIKSSLLNMKNMEKGYYSYHREGPSKVQTCTQQVLRST